MEYRRIGANATPAGKLGPRRKHRYHASLMSTNATTAIIAKVKTSCATTRLGPLHAHATRAIFYLTTETPVWTGMSAKIHTKTHATLTTENATTRTVLSHAVVDADSREMLIVLQLAGKKDVQA